MASPKYRRDINGKMELFCCHKEISDCPYQAKDLMGK